MVGNKSFTLIELLVVIAIIGLLASIVLVSTGGLQSKARITKTLEFSQSVQRGLGAYAVGIWSFDDQTNPTKDGSGYGNNGTVNGAAFSSDTPHAAIDRGTGKYSLSFNGSTNFVNMGDPSSGALDFGTRDFTLEGWFYLNSLPSNWKSIINKGASGAVGYGIEINTSNQFTASIQGTGGTNQHISSASSAVSAGQWYHGVAVFDRDDKIYVYLNGKLAASAAYASGNNNSVDNGTNFNIGRYSSGWYFNGLIDEVRIYEKALALGEIQKHYTEGLEGHQNLATRKIWAKKK